MRKRRRRKCTETRMCNNNWCIYKCDYTWFMGPVRHRKREKGRKKKSFYHINVQLKKYRSGFVCLFVCWVFFFTERPLVCRLSNGKQTASGYKKKTRNCNKSLNIWTWTFLCKANQQKERDRERGKRKDTPVERSIWIERDSAKKTKKKKKEKRKKVSEF